MKIQRVVPGLLLFSTSLFAALQQTTTTSTGPAGETKKIEWKKDGKLLLTQHIFEGKDRSLGLIRIGEAGTDITVWITAGRVAGISTHKPGFLVSLDDFTKDGVPDLLQIKAPDSNRLIEAFTITKGVIEPLPEEKYQKNREEFYFDEEIVEYLKKKETA